MDIDISVKEYFNKTINDLNLKAKNSQKRLVEA